MRKGKRIVMVATSAFGLGIDKPDIRYIVHYQAPASLERYVQEAGRAGRDGQIARCILLFDESDLAIQEHLLALSRLSPTLLGRFGRALAAWAGEERDANIEELALSAGISQRAASSLVTALVEAGICERVDGGRVHALGPLDTLVERVEGLREPLRGPAPRGRAPPARRRRVRRGDGLPQRRAAALLRRRRSAPVRALRSLPRAGRGGAGAGAPPATASHRDRRPRAAAARRRRAGIAAAGDGNATARRAARPASGAAAGGAGAAGGAAGAAPGPSGMRVAALPPPRRRRTGPFALPPLDPAADDLAAELGAPGLPPERRRRRRRAAGSPRRHATGAVAAAGAVTARGPESRADAGRSAPLRRSARLPSAAVASLATPAAAPASAASSGGSRAPRRRRAAR